MLYLKKFIQEHSNWEELLSKEPYCLKISRDGKYIMFKYDMIGSDFRLPEVREARGIIFNEQNWDCVCHPFDKFGNYGESYCPNIDWPSASVQEKIDGSLIKFWYDDNRWHISTNGTIDAFKCGLPVNLKFKTFGELVQYALPVNLDEFTKHMKKNHTYMFELISPYNRVVIDYSDTKLIFLGERNLQTGNEIKVEQSGFYDLMRSYITYPRRYDLHTLEDVKNAANKLPWNEEGYVVCDKYFNRVKIKSPEYVKAHYARNNNVINKERLIDIILCGEEAEFLIYASDFKEELFNIKKEYEETVSEIRNTIKEMNPLSYASRKNFALDVNKKPSWIRGFLFRYDTIEESMKKMTASKWAEVLEARGGSK